MKTILTTTFKTLALGLILAASVHSAQAGASPVHTYVSGTASASDSNPCSRTQPCATFQAALANTAPGGVITALDAGDYGAVTISQAVTIDGTGAQASIVNSGTDAITINDPTATDTIILRHLAITESSGASSGVALVSGNLVVDDCKISGSASTYGLDLESSGNTVVENTTVTGGYAGIYNGSSGLVSLRTVTLQGNQYGLIAAGGTADISHSQITQNSYAGLYAVGSTVSASGCMISGNGTGIYATTGGIIRLTNNDILNNTTGIGTNDTGIVSTTGNNRKTGNTTSGAPTPGRVIVQQ